MHKCPTGPIALALFTVAAVPAAQAYSGYFTMPQAASVAQFNYELQANNWYSLDIEKALPTDSDRGLQHAIINVFTDPEEEWAGEGLPHGTPRVPVVPAHVGISFTSPATRRFKILVRGDSESTPGYSVALRITRYDSIDQQRVVSSVASTVYLETPVGSRVLISGGLIANTHIRTSMTPGGIKDSILMLLTGENVIRYDDDNGPGLMSWIHLDGGACASCPLFVGNILNAKFGGDQPTPAATPNASVKLFWDEDVHNGRDRDQDSLGDALEAMLGTNPDLADSDGDGIDDGAEVYGIIDDPSHQSDFNNLLLFPAYGANPSEHHKDIFVEADWLPSCLDTNPLCGQPGGIDKLSYRFTASQVDVIRSMFVTDPQANSSDFYIHMDTEDPTCTPPEVCGDWGGAQM